jgi:hypothetical protein
MEQLDYEIKYKPGPINKAADALSRLKINNLQATFLEPTVLQQLIKDQAADPTIVTIVNSLIHKDG